MNALDSLIKHFERFPGIGSRQARRFAYHLLREPDETLNEFAGLITGIKEHVRRCESCLRYFAANGSSPLCDICANEARDITRLLIVTTDADIPVIERSGTYQGRYFVLGGLVPLLGDEEVQKLNGGALKQIVAKRIQDDALTELILGLPVNPDGENTARYIKQLLADTLKDTDVTITELGRGLSTGSELEYADPETIKNALQNRSSI